jgi:hypothetical protein
MSQAKLGSGARFHKLAQMLADQRNVKDPKALASAIGRKKFGNAKMASLAQKGKK